MRSNWILVVMAIGVMFVTLSHEKPLHSHYNDDYSDDVKKYNEQMDVEQSHLFQNLLRNMRLVPPQPIESGSYVELVRDVREPDAKKSQVTKKYPNQCFFKICPINYKYV